MDGSRSANEDRRAHPRYRVSCAASLERPDGKQRLSLVRDLSASGARMLVASSKLGVGDTVRVVLHLDDAECAASGRVVRVEVPGDAGIWKQEVAVRFDDRLGVDPAAVPR